MMALFLARHAARPQPTMQYNSCQFHAQRFPPTPAELRTALDGGAEAPAPQSAAAQPSAHGGKASSRAHTSAGLSAAAVVAKHTAWQQRQARPEVAALAAVRAKLPISSFRWPYS